MSEEKYYRYKDINKPIVFKNTLKNIKKQKRKKDQIKKIE